mgnify:CR=1 FL=1
MKNLTLTPETFAALYSLLLSPELRLRGRAQGRMHHRLMDALDSISEGHPDAVEFVYQAYESRQGKALLAVFEANRRLKIEGDGEKITLEIQDEDFEFLSRLEEIPYPPALNRAVCRLLDAIDEARRRSTQ